LNLFCGLSEFQLKANQPEAKPRKQFNEQLSSSTEDDQIPV
jgi:hypothetical protein